MNLPICLTLSKMKYCWQIQRVFWELKYVVKLKWIHVKSVIWTDNNGYQNEISGLPRDATGWCMGFWDMLFIAYLNTKSSATWAQLLYYEFKHPFNILSTLEVRLALEERENELWFEYLQLVSWSSVFWSQITWVSDNLSGNLSVVVGLDGGRRFGCTRNINLIC